MRLQQLRAACERMGFFTVIGHGIDQQSWAGATSALTSFFKQPLEEKLQVGSATSGPPMSQSDQLLLTVLPAVALDHPPTRFPRLSLIRICWVDRQLTATDDIKFGYVPRPSQFFNRKVSGSTSKSRRRDQGIRRVDKLLDDGEAFRVGP
jgi:isopenicillin N synthase-like dioxygenase